MKNIFSLFLWIVVSFSAGWFGSQFKPGVWYDSLQKPTWTPPAIAFPIAWAILYTLMGVAAWIVWGKRDDPSVKWALSIFLGQLLLNALWSWIFFGLHQMGWALLEITGLWLTLALTLNLFFKISPVAGYLLTPYFLWIGFAIALNFAIWKNN